MSTFDCAELDAVAPELALGTLPGDERAAALRHLEHCAECQLLVEQLSNTADALLLLAPEADPPAGFARRTMAGFGERPRRSRWRAVAAVVAAGVLALALGLALGSTTSVGNRYRPTPFALRDPDVRMTRFAAVGGEHLQGQVFSYAKRPSWVFMTVRNDGTGDTYVCQLELADGRVLEIGSFQLSLGAGSWGRALADDVGPIKTVRLVDEAGHTAASASLASAG